MTWVTLISHHSGCNGGDAEIQSAGPHSSQQLLDPFFVFFRTYFGESQP